MFFSYVVDTVPNLLMSDDFAVDDSDSDLEIDPGTISPPPQGTPIRMQESPTVEELLSTIGKLAFYLSDLQLPWRQKSYFSIGGVNFYQLAWFSSV